MEAVLLPYSPDHHHHHHHQPISPYKQIKNQKRNNTNRALNFSRPTENFAPPSNNFHGGGPLLGPPPSLFHSFPPSPNPLFNHPLHLNLLPLPPPQQQQRQPPLLPLPISRAYSSLPSRLSSSPPNKKPNNKTRDQSLTPKKLKQQMKRKECSKEDLKHTTTTQSISDESLVMAEPAKPLGPDPKDLEKFSGSVFTLSPPPSSLPLPKFPLRPKLSCKAEAAAEIDTGATDNLRRLLRLR